MLKAPKTIAAGLLAGTAILMPAHAGADELQIIPEGKKHVFNDRATGTAVVVSCAKMNDATRCDVRAIGNGSLIEFSQSHVYSVDAGGALKITSTPPQGEWESYSSGPAYDAALKKTTDASWDSSSPLAKALEADAVNPVRQDFSAVTLKDNVLSVCGIAPTSKDHGFKICSVFSMNAEGIQNLSTVELQVTPYAFFNGNVVKGDAASVTRPFNQYDMGQAKDMAYEAREGQTVFTTPAFR